jgi:predicted MPP superfamily phosphohydrolase
MNNTEFNSKPKTRISRRDFLKITKVAGLGVLFAASGNVLFSQFDPDWLDVSQVRLVLPHLPASFSGVRIVQVSDIHMGGWMNLERLQQVFDVVRSLAPSLIALTGDFVLTSDHAATNFISEMGKMEAELKTLAASYPTLAVLGNHDYWYDASAVLAMLERSGVRPMVNDVQRVQIGRDFVDFAGVGDVLVGENRLDQMLTKLPGQGCAILMAHEPDFADESAASGRFDLQISGHSHGGQVNLPLIGAPVLPQFGRKYPMGLYRVGSMYQYTNRGVGMTPPYVRFNCRAEITVFTLQSL